VSRDHARIQTAIWQDRDFRGLSVPAQHMYMTVLSQPTLSRCGVLDFIATRLAALSASQSVRKVQTTVAELERCLFVVVDRHTCELLVRTYVRHDGVLDRENMGKAVARALSRVVSLDIRDAVVYELARVFSQRSDLSGWRGFADVDRDGFERVRAMASAMASPNGMPDGIGDDIRDEVRDGLR
jgi:hypothetical protein